MPSLLTAPTTSPRHRARSSKSGRSLVLPDHAAAGPGLLVHHQLGRARAADLGGRLDRAGRPRRLATSPRRSRPLAATATPNQRRPIAAVLQGPELC
jgi:hypothetical protein